MRRDSRFACRCGDGKRQFGLIRFCRIVQPLLALRNCGRIGQVCQISQHAAATHKRVLQRLCLGFQLLLRGFKSFAPLQRQIQRAASFRAAQGNKFFKIIAGACQGLVHAATAGQAVNFAGHR